MFRSHDAQGLEKAKPEQLSAIEISLPGFGIRFPAIDADSCLPGLLEGVRGSRKWMASRFGKAGGKATSEAKAAAARANGKRGGWPKKRRAADAA